MMGAGEEMILVAEALWVPRSESGLLTYDFPMERFFPFRRPRQRTSDESSWARGEIRP